MIFENHLFMLQYYFYFFLAFLFLIFLSTLSFNPRNLLSPDISFIHGISFLIEHHFFKFISSPKCRTVISLEKIVCKTTKYNYPPHSVDVGERFGMKQRKKLNVQKRRRLKTKESLLASKIIGGGARPSSSFLGG